jgi:hypothetical protein
MANFNDAIKKAEAHPGDKSLERMASPKTIAFLRRLAEREMGYYNEVGALERATLVHYSEELEIGEDITGFNQLSQSKAGELIEILKEATQWDTSLESDSFHKIRGDGWDD